MEQETKKNQEGTWKDEDWELDLTFKCGTPKLYAALRKAGYDIRTGARRKGSQPDKEQDSNQR